MRACTRAASHRISQRTYMFTAHDPMFRLAPMPPHSSPPTCVSAYRSNLTTERPARARTAARSQRDLIAISARSRRDRISFQSPRSTAAGTRTTDVCEARLPHIIQPAAIRTIMHLALPAQYSAACTAYLALLCRTSRYERAGAPSIPRMARRWSSWSQVMRQVAGGRR